MQDRVSETPGRMLITPENGQPAFYATVELADNPTVVGTPLNKASLLTDATAALFGLGTDAVPDDVLEKARELITAAQNTANTVEDNLTFSQIGTANLSNIGSLVSTGTLSINLTGNLRNYSEILIVTTGTSGASSTSYVSLLLDNIQNYTVTGGDTIGAYLLIQIRATFESYIHIISQKKGSTVVPAYNIYRAFNSTQYRYSGLNGGMYKIPSASVLNFAVSSRGNVGNVSGTISVYGKSF